MQDALSRTIWPDGHQAKRAKRFLKALARLASFVAGCIFLIAFVSLSVYGDRQADRRAAAMETQLDALTSRTLALEQRKPVKLTVHQTGCVGTIPAAPQQIAGPNDQFWQNPADTRP